VGREAIGTRIPDMAQIRSLSIVRMGVGKEPVLLPTIAVLLTANINLKLASFGRGSSGRYRLTFGERLSY
jgi:hypothetical protein